MAITIMACALILVVLAALAFGFWVWKQRPAQAPATDAVLPLLMDLKSEMGALRTRFGDQVADLNRQMNTQMQENVRYLQQSHDGFHKTVGEVQGRLGQLQQATQNMVDIGRDISSLQDILRAPKLRGGLGELLLSELLRQILPGDHFALQYAFRDGTIVDAVILLGQGMIPVDAKFPYENFKRMLEASEEAQQAQFRKIFFQDVKKHIDQIALKYILPVEGTFDFALMYIPAENVYYETIIKDDNQEESLATYAMKKRVIAVSPNSFYAYLQAIARGLKALRIERSAQIILESLAQLEADFGKCMEEFEKTGSHLNNAQSAYGRAMRKFEKLHDRLSALEDVRKGQIQEVKASLTEDA